MSREQVTGKEITVALRRVEKPWLNQCYAAVIFNPSCFFMLFLRRASIQHIYKYNIRSGSIR
jgi:hypothetical protein